MQRERSETWWSAHESKARMFAWGAVVVGLSLGAYSCGPDNSSTDNGAMPSDNKVKPVVTVNPRPIQLNFNPSNPGPGVYVLDWEEGENPAVEGSPPGWNHQFIPGRAAVIDSPGAQPRGRKSARFELRSNEDPTHKHRMRSELAASPSEEPYADRWYGFSIYLPENWVSTDKGEILTQWHQNRLTGSPPLAIMTKGEQWVIDRKKWDDSNDTIPFPVPGKFARGQWTDWVVHARWSKDDGIIEVWKDGIGDDHKVFTHRGQTAYTVKPGEPETAVANYMKFGIYKWTWPDNSNRKLWMCHDEVRTASGPADRLRDVAPPTLIPTPTPTPTHTPTPTPTKVKVPDVRELSSSSAANVIHKAKLVPLFTGHTGPNTYVAAQSPKADTIVQVGSTVKLHLKTGPVP